MEEFSARTRAANLEAMAAQPLDVLVIGGGIVGAWTALTSALRGHRTGLVEKGDFASGTSGKTSRLVHGGLRYLQKYRIGIVRQAARERDILLRIAPDLVKPLTFLIPVYRGRGAKVWQLRIGLWLYDALSKEKVLPRRKWLTRDEALAREPHLAGEGLLGAATYSDAITRDSRLVLSVTRKAAEAGALVASYARVTDLVREDGAVVGATVLDKETGTARTVRARDVVNATGVWMNDLRTPERHLRLRPTKGIHLFLPRARIGNRGAVVLPTPDRRIIFVLPWGELALVGTTDTDYRADADRVEADDTDIGYLLDSLNRGFPEARLTPSDVVGTYAGLRPLVDTGETKESDISRRHEIAVDPDRLISVAGGKLTTARAMAVEVLWMIEVRRIAEDAEAAKDLSWGRRRAAEFEKRTDPAGIRLSDVGPAVASTDVGAVAAHAVRQEMAIHIDDVLVRRTHLFYELDDQGVRIAPVVVEAMGAELGWDAERRASELARYRGIVEASRRWREEPPHA